MTIRYVSSAIGNNDANDGSTWTLAKATIANALAASTGNGDIIYVDKDHSYTPNAAIAWTVTTSKRVSIIAVDRNGSTTTGHNGWAAAADVLESCGAATAVLSIVGIDQTHLFVHGIKMVSGNSAGTSDIIIGQQANSSHKMTFSKCKFSLASANTGCQLLLGSSAGGTVRGQEYRFLDCTFENTANRGGTYGALGNAEFEFVNPAFSFSNGTTNPAIAFASTVNNRGRAVFRDGDMATGLASAALFDRATMSLFTLLVKNCKLPSSLMTSTYIDGVGSITVRNAASTDTVAAFYYETPYGSLTAQATTFASTGASFNGTPMAWAVTTTTLCDEGHPFALPAITVWNETLSAQQASIEATNGTTLLKDGEIWLELSYLGSATFPIGAAVSDRDATPFEDGASIGGTSQAAGAATWGSPPSSNQDIKLHIASFTASDNALLEGVVKVTRPSVTSLYVDPKLRLAAA